MEWPDSSSTESRIFCDLPVSGVRAIVSWAIESLGEPAVVKNLNETKVEGQADWLSVDVGAIQDTAGHRQHFANAAACEKKNPSGKTTHKAWFKSINGGEAIGNVLFDHYTEIGSTPTGVTLNVIRKWVDEQP